MKNQAKQEDITLEASLLNVMSSKKEFEKFSKVLDRKQLISTTAFLLNDYTTYYKNHNSDIDWNIFYTEFSQNWHAACTCKVPKGQSHKLNCLFLDRDDLAWYRETVFPLIQNSVADNGIYIALLERESHLKIQTILEKGVDSTQIGKVLSELSKQKAAYSNEKDESVFQIANCDLTKLDNSNGITWFMPSLQASLGSLMPGQFIVVAADSDVGKSAFCISQAVHVFKQIALLKNNIVDKRPILYCTSEDTKEDLACRFLSCLYRDKCPRGFEEIVSNFTNVSDSYVRNFDDSMFIGVPVRGVHDLPTIKSQIDRYNPALIIIDMLDKLSSSDNIQDLTKLYQDIRGIANDGYAIIGTSQTGNTSYQDKDTKEYKHRRWLTDKDLANSKSGKQGAAYCMIMIGKDDDQPSIRYISTTKKKRGKHCNITATIVDKYSCYKELL